MFELAHVAISVKDINRSVDFYKKFGFEDYKNYKDDNVEITMLKLNNMVLEIFCYEEYENIPEHAINLSLDLKTIGTKHIGIGVDNIENGIKFVKDNNLAENINICHGRLGKDYFFIKDPDGILVEIIERD